MQFEHTNPQTELETAFGGFFSINAFGNLEPGDDVKFLEFLEHATPPPRTMIYINSNGGHVETAMAIGRAIRNGWFATSIGTYVIDHNTPSEFIRRRELIPGTCLSAATLMHVGGRLRYFEKDAKFGVHQFSFQNPSPEDLSKSQILSAKIAKYINEMGVSADFLELSSSVTSAEIKLVDEETLKSLRVITGGMTDVEWTVHARGKMFYVRGERDSLFGHQKVMLGHVKDQGFHFFSVIEAQGREKELTTFPLTEIILNGEDIRIDVSNRCLRFEDGLYVHVISKITEEEARSIAYSESFGVQIRASKFAEIFFGISAMPTDGGNEQLDTLFSSFAAG